MLQQIHLHLLSAYQRILENCYRIVRRIHQHSPMVSGKGSIEVISSIEQELRKGIETPLGNLDYLVDVSIAREM